MVYSHPIASEKWDLTVKNAKRVIEKLPHPTYENLLLRRGENNVDLVYSFRTSQTQPPRGHCVVYPLNKDAYQKIQNFKIKSGSDIWNEHIEEDWRKVHAIYIAYLVRYDANQLSKIPFAYDGIIDLVFNLNQRNPKKSIIICAKPSFITYGTMRKKGFSRIVKDEFFDHKALNEEELILGKTYYFKR